MQLCAMTTTRRGCEFRCRAHGHAGHFITFFAEGGASAAIYSMAHNTDATNALMSAARRLDVDAMRAALESGAAPQPAIGVVLGEEETGLSDDSRLAALRLLAAHGAVPNVDAPKTALRSGCGLPVIKHLIGGLGLAEWRDSRGCTLLHWTTRPQHARELLAAGLPVGAHSTDVREAALHTMTSRVGRYVEVAAFGALVAVMVAAGADVDAADITGWTPLHVAALRLGGSKCLPAAVAALLDAGANPALRDYRSQTPLEMVLAHMRPHELAATVSAMQRRRGCERMSASVRAARLLLRASAWRRRRHLLLAVRARTSGVVGSSATAVKAA